MKAAGMDDWFINSMTELYGIIIIRADYASGLSLAVEKITEKKPNLSLSLPEIMQRLLNGINVILANHSLNR
jgi:hypothetical protein